MPAVDPPVWLRVGGTGCPPTDCPSMLGVESHSRLRRRRTPRPFADSSTRERGSASLRLDYSSNGVPPRLQRQNHVGSIDQTPSADRRATIRPVVLCATCGNSNGNVMAGATTTSPGTRLHKHSLNLSSLGPSYTL